MSRRYKTLQAAVDGSEADFQALVIDLAQTCGWRVWHTRDMTKCPISMIGAPDLLLLNGERGMCLFRELKTATGKLSPAQEAWGRDLKAAGCDWGVWRPEHWPQIRRILMGR